MVDETLLRLAREARDPEARRLFHTELRRAGLAPGIVVRSIRHGFATNSSSSHSIILAEGLEDDWTGTEGLGFGWGNFVLASREAKSRYFAVALAKHYERLKLGPQETVALVRRALPSLPASITDDDVLDGYIDHESDPVFPKPRLSRQGMDPLWKLIRDTIIDDDRVVVLGGNDNDEEPHPRSGAGPDHANFYKVAAIEGYQTDRVYLRDDGTGHFAVFDRKGGTKVRFTVGDAPEPAHSSVPEVIDVKITDYCAMGCQYCYQGSTTKGKHAGERVLSGLTYKLRELGVFEVAIGGGEPTAHPGFADVLTEFSRSGVVPSFSTQSWEWLDGPLAKVVAETCGAVALSTQNPDHVRPWLTKCKERGIRAHLHYVLGLSPLENLARFIRSYGDREGEGWDCGDGPGRAHVVLLAHKAMGRAEGKKPIPYGAWQSTVRKALTEKIRHAWTIAVDSFLVDDVKAGFSESEVAPVLYEKSDGRFTCYFDAVEEEWAVHSFVPKGERFKGGPYDLERAWAMIRGVPLKEESLA